tara:strand:- start:2682 stop:2900 length:219 start_codon:yes stop_codon:yes gene_type:complete
MRNRFKMGGVEVAWWTEGAPGPGQIVWVQPEGQKAKCIGRQTSSSALEAAELLASELVPFHTEASSDAASDV